MLSQASSISGVMGDMWLERYALAPNFFSSRRRYACRASGYGGTNAGMVLMHVHSFELYILSAEQKTLVGIEFDAAHADAHK